MPKKKKSFRNNLSDGLQNMLVAKSSCVVSGWMLNCAISATVLLIVSPSSAKKAASSISASSELAGGAQGSLALVEAIFALLLIILVFVIILVATALLARTVRTQVPDRWLPERWRTLYANGLGFIPAWQFKNVVSALMVACVGGSVADRSPYLIASVVLGITILTALLQIMLEQWDDDLDEETLAFQAIDKLRTSMGLGIGFALNVAVNALVGANMKSPLIQISYVACLTVIVAILEFKGKPVINAKEGFWPPLLIRTLKFLLLASNFVVGWAWKGMLDSIFAAHFHEGVFEKFMEATLITAAMIMLVILVEVIAWFVVEAEVTVRRSINYCASGSVTEGSDLESGMPALQELCALVSAMNVGWAWGAYAMTILHDLEKRHNQGQPLGVGWIWLLSFVVVIVAGFVALLLEFIIRLIETSDPAEELLKEAGEWKRELSNGSVYGTAGNAVDCEAASDAKKD